MRTATLSEPMSESSDHARNNDHSDGDSAADRAGARNAAGRSATANSPSSNGRSPATAGGLAGANAVLTGQLRVWIDQDLCTGDGICTDHAPEVFTILEDGIAYCREGDRVFNDPGGSAELALVPAMREVDVVDAAAECPGECIFIEIEERPELTE